MGKSSEKVSTANTEAEGSANPVFDGAMLANYRRMYETGNDAAWPGTDDQLRAIIANIGTLESSDATDIAILEEMDAALNDAAPISEEITGETDFSAVAPTDDPLSGLDTVEAEVIQPPGTQIALSDTLHDDAPHGEEAETSSGTMGSPLGNASGSNNPPAVELEAAAKLMMLELKAFANDVMEVEDKLQGSLPVQLAKILMPYLKARIEYDDKFARLKVADRYDATRKQIGKILDGTVAAKTNSVKVTLPGACRAALLVADGVIQIANFAKKAQFSGETSKELTDGSGAPRFAAPENMIQRVVPTFERIGTTEKFKVTGTKPNTCTELRPLSGDHLKMLFEERYNAVKLNIVPDTGLIAMPPVKRNHTEESKPAAPTAPVNVDDKLMEGLKSNPVNAAKLVDHISIAAEAIEVGKAWNYGHIVKVVDACQYALEALVSGRVKVPADSIKATADMLYDLKTRLDALVNEEGELIDLDAGTGEAIKAA